VTTTSNRCSTLLAERGEYTTPVRRLSCRIDFDGDRVVSAEQLSRLLLILYEGASSPERIPAFLEALVQAVDADACVLREHTFHAEQGVQLETATLLGSTGHSAESLQAYLAYYWKVDPFLQRCLERFSDAECGVSQMLIGDSELKKTEIFSDWCRRYDHVGRMMWAKLSGDKGTHASVSIVRRLESPHFDDAELHVIAAVAPHLRQALRLARNLRDLKTSNSMLRQGTDEAGIAISLVRRDGSVLRSTEGAEHVFAAHDGVWVKNGLLRTAIPAEQNALDVLIAGACLTSSCFGLGRPLKVQLEAAGGAAVRSWTAQSGGAMLITRKPPCRPLQVVVSPFRAGSLLNEAQAAALVQFSSPDAIPRPRGAILRALYGLTPTESRMADLFLQGLETRDAAERMGITLETARWNLKRILSKTETGRQAELMRLMLSLPGA
jgi:DNA-binding CsgD family transcriptional regulator